MAETDTISFISELCANGVAMPSRYVIRFTFPTNLSLLVNAGSDARLNRRLSIACRSTQFPSKYVETKENKRAGITTIFADEQSFDNSVTLNFRLGKDHMEKEAFEIWQDMVVDPKTRTIGWYDEYAKNCSLTIYQLDTNGTYLYGAQMSEVFPTDIVDHNVNADIENDYQRFSVTIAFSTYQRVNVPNRNTLNIAPGLFSVNNVASNFIGSAQDSAGSSTLLSTVADAGLALIPSKTRSLTPNNAGGSNGAGKYAAIAGRVVNVLTT